MNSDEIVRQILEYIRQHGGAFRDWYVGIASDVKRRLHVDHNVPAESQIPWIYRGAATDRAARTAEQTLLAMGCDGGPGGGDQTTAVVYAYRKQWSTVER